MAVNSLGISDPQSAVGQFIRAGDRNFEVVGVIEDYHHKSLKDGLMPMVFFKSIVWSMGVGYYSFKLESYQTQTMESLAEVWKETYPGEEFIYNIQEETYKAQYRAENNFMKSFMLAALLALITSSLGLLAFARYNTIKRTREIGIRKTFGSDRGKILKLLHKESFIMVLGASIVGTPVSWLIVNRWLMNFSYRIDPAWWMFLLSVLITLLIAMATTFIQTSKASNMNPVDALRYE
jgi:putative ABC transport system permease protein